MQNKTTLLLIPEPLSSQRDKLLPVFGHRNPDCDAIRSTRVVADWRLGDITPETRYTLNAAGVSQPELLTTNLTGIDDDQFVTELLRSITDITGQPVSVLLNRDARKDRLHDVPPLLSQFEACNMADITPWLTDHVASDKR